MSQTIYILDAARTPIGNPFKSLKNFKAAQLAGSLIKNLLRRKAIDPNDVNEVILGNVVGAGTGQNLSRQASLLAGLPHDAVAMTINNVCGAGLTSVVLAAQKILACDCELIVAGGTESATHNPFLVSAEDFSRMNPDNLISAQTHDGLLCALTNKHMGELAEILAKKFRVSRASQDQYSLESHRRVIRAQESGKFKEICPLSESNGHVVSKDDRPRKNIDLEKLKILPSAFKKGGSVTAGNASVPCDGAAAVLIASGGLIRNRKWKPMARIAGYATVAVEPKMAFTAAVPAVRQSLKHAGLKSDDIQLYEISESFAVQAIVAQRQLEIDDEIMNIWGGDVALGHPLGAAGARVLGTLVHALDDQKKRFGVAVVCFGGGGAVSVVVERV